MTVRNIGKNLPCFTADTCMLRGAVRAALFSTVLGVGLLPTLAVAAQGSAVSSHRYNIGTGPLSDVLNQLHGRLQRDSQPDCH